MTKPRTQMKRVSIHRCLTLVDSHKSYVIDRVITLDYTVTVRDKRCVDDSDTLM